MTEYTGQGGLGEMQELTQRIWSPASRLHLGDLAWERSANAGRAAGWRTAVWRDGEEAGVVENEARALYQSVGFRPGSRTLHLLLG
jgi:hypothetical protein